MLWARRCVAPGHPEQAVGYLQTALKTRPDYFDAHYNLGIALAGQDDFAGASEQFRAGLAVAAARCECGGEPGSCPGRDGAASPRPRSHFERALQIDPNQPIAKENLGRAAKRNEFALIAKHRSRSSDREALTSELPQLCSNFDMQPALEAKRRSFVLRLAFLTAFWWAFTGSGLAQQSPAPEAPSAQASPASSAPPTEFAEARKLMQQGKVDEAIAESARPSRPATPRTKGLALEMGTAYYKKSDFPKAIEYLKKATAADPANSEATQLLGLSYYLGGHPADAIPLLEKVQGWYPRANVDASYILGICYIQTKDYPQARKAFARMFDVPAGFGRQLLVHGANAVAPGIRSVAEEYAQKAVALDPKLPLVHFLLGELYLYKSRIPEAITEFQKELAINPGHAATYYKLADAYSRVQKFDDAERLLQRSIWLDATSTGPYILMGKVLEKKGEFELAVRALQRAATMDPNNPTTHHLLGQAYRDHGEERRGRKRTEAR